MRLRSLPLRKGGDALCLDCHDGRAGAPDVLGQNTGTHVRQAGALPIGVPPFKWTNGHDLGVTAVPPGGTTVVTLDCTTCHNPHGSEYYRNLPRVTYAKDRNNLTLTGSNAPLEGSLGHLGARIFALGALWLNAGIIFWLVTVYQWMFGRFRNNPPKLLGTMFSGTYALLAFFVYVDATRCSGFLCDIGVMLAAEPWSMLSGVHFRGGGMFLVLLMLAANSILLYAALALLAPVFWKMKRVLGG